MAAAMLWLFLALHDNVERINRQQCQRNEKLAQHRFAAPRLGALDAAAQKTLNRRLSHRLALVEFGLAPFLALEHCAQVGHGMPDILKTDIQRRKAKAQDV